MIMTKRQPVSVGEMITEEYLKPYEIENRAVLFYTGWDKHWNTEKYYENNPHLTKSCAEYLKDSQVKLVGIDSLNVDSTAEQHRPGEAKSAVPRYLHQECR